MVCGAVQRGLQSPKRGNRSEAKPMMNRLRKIEILAGHMRRLPARGKKPYFTIAVKLEESFLGRSDRHWCIPTTTMSRLYKHGIQHKEQAF